jgi:uncharacterized membrane protein
MRKILQLLALAAVSAVCACGGGTGDLAQVDPMAAPQTPTYTEHVGPIMDRYCTACHAKDAQPGALEGFDYSTCDGVKRGWGGVVETVFFTETMPPGGAQRVTSSDELTLERWYDQGARCD